MKLVDDCKGAWRHYSTKALVLAGGLQGMWAGLPDAVHSALPDTVGKAVAWITFGVAMLGLGGKFVDQTPKDKP